MINFILMLLGLAFPNSNAANTQTNNGQGNTTVVQTNNADPGDTGGETYVPPKR